MSYVYGPVSSRRLGRSLGIDLIPLKTCNWNCVYCQLGRTRPMTFQRSKYAPREEVLTEVLTAIRSNGAGKVDWVTFAGSGEPLLSSDVGWLIHQIKQAVSLPVAVITNGTLLFQEEVRQELLEADAVLPTLDAGSEPLYRKINRPHPSVSFQKHVEGLKKFRKEYKGKLWVEVMLMQGVNDTEEALRDLSQILEEVRPDEIHLNFPVRPPAEGWVALPEAKNLLLAQTLLGGRVKVMAPVCRKSGLLGNTNLETAVIEMVRRHPVPEEEILELLSHHGSKKTLRQVLTRLYKGNRVKKIHHEGRLFLVPYESRYVFKNSSSIHPPACHE